MRAAALALVLFGAVVLGSWGIDSAARDSPTRRTGLTSPLAGGITLVVGLLILVGAGRRADG